MKSIVFQHVFNCISTYVHEFPEYLLSSFDNLSIKFDNVVLFNKYNEMKMCDLEPFYKIQSYYVKFMSLVCMV